MNLMLKTDEAMLIEASDAASGGWRKWWGAFKQILPLYVAIHVLCLVVSGFTPIFIARSTVPLYTFWQQWHSGDTGHYMGIATLGYDYARETAFFPLYPLLIRLTMFVLHNALVSALLVSNIANALMLMVFYQLVRENFDDKIAHRAVLYISIFPMSFFFVAAYTESLFLALTLFAFYHARRGNWWLAGVFGLLVGLTRSAGVLLLLPLCFEYMRQRQFQWRQIRWNVLALGLVPGGIVLYALYCFWSFGDPLTFAHVENLWHRGFTYPWWGLITSVMSIHSSEGLLSHIALRNLADLIPVLVVIVLLILGIVGPWRFRKEQIAYVLLGVIWMFFNISAPLHDAVFPLRSQARYALIIFPAFIVLAALGKYRTIHLSYVLASAAIMCALLIQFLVGRWVI